MALATVGEERTSVTERSRALSTSGDDMAWATSGGSDAADVPDAAELPDAPEAPPDGVPDEAPPPPPAEGDEEVPPPPPDVGWPGLPPITPVAVPGGGIAPDPEEIVHPAAHSATVAPASAAASRRPGERTAPPPA